MSHGLLLWLENIDRRRNEIVPIDHSQDTETLHGHHKTLSVLQVYQYFSAQYESVTSSSSLSSLFPANSPGAA